MEAKDNILIFESDKEFEEFSHSVLDFIFCHKLVRLPVHREVLISCFRFYTCKYSNFSANIR